MGRAKLCAHLRSFLGALTVCALLLGGCATARQGAEAQAVASGGTPNGQAERISDERILAERKGLEGLQQRIVALNKAGLPVKHYGLAKAQCWLDSAKTQFHENDRSGYVEAAVNESLAIVRALELDKTSTTGQQTPLVVGSEKLRDDLWQRLGNLKSHRGFECAAQTVACAEVRLVRAGHAQRQTGWRQASPHIAMVEDATKAAVAEADSCARPSLRAVQPTLAPAQAQPSAIDAMSATTGAVHQPAPQMIERVQVLTDTLFEFGKSDVESMLPEGRSQLDALVVRLRGLKSVERIVVHGFTDRMGSDEQNGMLSGARASTVRNFLVSKGLPGDRITAIGRGKSAPGTSCSKGLTRKALIKCLQPDRRVEIEVFGLAR